jgi:hypothetical protein
MVSSCDFWLSCGHHLLDRNAAGRLVVTDEFLKAYLARPELVPPPEACVEERALHRALLREPRLAIAASQIAAIADADARENWQMMAAWRDFLLQYDCLEAAYVAIARTGIHFPQILVSQLVQVILRNVLDDCDDVFMLRAAEMFFRPQKMAFEGTLVVAVDEETEAARVQHPPSPLFSLLGLQTATGVELLSKATSESYWERSDRFDMALDLAPDGRGLTALGDVITRWLAHLLGIDVAVEPVTETRNLPWNWYVGLSSEATHIGNAIWRGELVADAMRAQLIGLLRMSFRDPADMSEGVRGEPVHLLLATSSDGHLRIKPQNLLTGLPVRDKELAN